MKEKKGFTLIELLAVILLIGVLAIIAIPAISKYLIASKDTTYSTFEKSMEIAAKNKIVDCISNNDQCELPDKDRGQKIFLDLLIDEGYIDNMKDPDSSSLCRETASYVSIRGTELNDYEYTACLYCGSYATDDSECDEYNKQNEDPEDPVCGEISGASTRWTKDSRTITVGCSDKSSGCELTNFSKVFNRTTKTGQITIRDRSGRTVSCDVNAYVDKTLPTCRIEVEGDYINNTGWYTSGTKAKLVDISDTDSGILSYGMGTSINNREYNKKTSFEPGNGITTVLGYTKDIAGNEGLCSQEVRIGLDVPKFNLFYGYRIFPEKAVYTLENITESGTNFTTTSSSPKITINNLSRYKDVEIVKITLNSVITTSTTATIKSGSMTKNGLMQQGSSVIDFLVPKGTYDNFEIYLGQVNGETYNINKIEVLTKDGATWSSENMELYIESMDQGVKSTQVSYDNGTTWTDTFHKTFTASVEDTVIVKNVLGLQSDPTTYKMYIDKTIPTVSVVAKKKTNNGNVISGTYTNDGLNYLFQKDSVGPSGAQIYYCKDTQNSCTPNIEIDSNSNLVSYNNDTTNYYIRYIAKTGAGAQGNLNTYTAKFDLEKPQCSFDNINTINITREVNVKLTCIDTISGLVSKTITASDFTISNSNMSIKSVTQSATSNGIEILITLKGDAKGNSTITFKANTFNDNALNSNDSVSKTININGNFNITLNNQSATSAGTTNIYENYGTGWYSDSGLTSSITTITKPTRNGYTFGGYYTSTGGSGTQIIDASGSILAQNTTYTSTATIYAKWVECGNGSYCSGGTKTSCPAGTYGNGKTTESTQAGACTTCEKGYYCAGGTSRVGCGNGKYNDLTGQSASSACKNITAGCYGANATSACPASCSGRTKYSAAGASACSTVSNGYYTTGCNSSGNNCTGQSQCTAGNYCSNGVSNACGAGKYSSSAGATSCSNITAGCYGTSATSACPASCSGRTKYSAAGASACSTVSNGYYTTGCNSSGNNCTGQSQCSAGTYCSSGVQSACSGRTKYSAAGATSCSSVSTGYYTTGCNSSGNNCTGQSQCTAGNYCVNGVSNKCATYYYSAAGATSCYDNTTPTINDYTATTVKDTLSSMTLCSLGSDTGSGLKQIEYYFSCNSTHKTATISGGCATITVTACSNATFYYRLKDDRNWSGWKSTSNFGAYYLLAREYNKLLMYNPANNNASNITFHVDRINGNLAGRLTEVGTTAINNSTSVSNEEIVKRMYRGILGREPGASEVTGHVNNLKNGKTRAQVLADFINSTEAKKIRSSWGY